MRAVALLLLVAACGGEAASGKAATVPATPQTESEELARARMASELTDDILASYERDEPPEVATDMVRPEIGGARIGFGADDIVFGDQLAHPPSLWRRDPLAPGAAASRMLVDGDSDLRSKDLHVELAADRSAAWVSDEISWRIPACGRTAVIPMRSTALYAHDGDRWILVFEHVSFARPLQLPSDAPPRHFKQQVVRDIADPLSAVLQGALTGRGRGVIGTDAHLVGPDVGDDWLGAAILSAHIGNGTVRAQDRRVGTIGRAVVRASVAYWIGDFDVDAPGGAGKIPLRGTFVFEKRKGNWVVVQGHLSQPIGDDELAQRVFGTALVSLAPLRLSCGA